MGNRKSLYLLPIITVVLSALAVTFMPAQSASALSGSQFDASYIIDDTIFYDGDSMSTTEVQNFLNAKVPNCDTNGEKRYTGSKPAIDYNGNGTIQRWERGKYAGNPKPFTCLKNYKQNTPERAAESGICGYLPARTGRTAAAIITDISNACGISPKALIVLLQKEQALVTDDWPWKVQYQKATGYGCPDTAPCNSAYYGFFNQVYKAAWQFKKYQANPGNYNYVAGQNNKIYYNPKASCGYSWVKIRNNATAGLYNYTPYRPNKAALDNLYGLGNTCSAYGNRNFWRMFNDWFGSPTANLLFKIDGGGDTIYLNWGSAYYTVPSMTVLRAYGLANKPIQTIDNSQIQNMAQGPALRTLAKFGTSDTIYLIDGGLKRPIPDMTMFGDYGFSTGDVQTYTDSNLTIDLRTGSTIRKLARSSSGAIYFIDNAKRQVFPDYETFTTLGPSLTGGSLSYTSLSKEFTDAISEGAPLLLNGKAVKSKDSPAIYLYNQGELMWYDAATWKSWGSPLDYGNFTNASLVQIPMASEPAPLLATDGSYRYLVNGGKKYKFTNSSQTAWGLDSSDFKALPSDTLSALGSGPNVGTLLRAPSGSVYVLRNNQKVAIPSMDDFSGLGYSWRQVQNLQTNALDILSTSSSMAFAPKSLIRLPNGTISWVDTNFTIHTIPSMDVFSAYKFSANSIRQYNQNNVLDIYANTPLARVVKSTGGSYYLVDRGKRLSISTSAYGSAQYAFASKPQVQLSNKLLETVADGAALKQFIQGSTSTVYKVENGKKHPISSPSSLFAHGGSWGSITKVSDSFLTTISTGSTY